VKRVLDPIRAALFAFFTAPLRFYMRFISPALPRTCKYEPTCSAYAMEALKELGVMRGTIVAAWRVLRCNPWSHGGWDPVSDRRIFRASGTPGPSKPSPGASA
jgi:uncharacterized protein